VTGAERTFVRRLALLVSFEVRKLVARRLPVVAFVLVLLVALVAPTVGHVVDSASALMSGKTAKVDKFANGWTALAGSVTTARPFVVLVLLVLASSTVAEEAAHGTLRALLVRPVRRGEVLAAKALACWGYAVLLLVAVVLAALAGGELTRGLYDITDPDYVERTKHTFGAMLRFVAIATALSLPPLLAFTGLGLLISTLMDHAGHATGAAVGALFVLSAAAGLLDPEQGRFVFVSYASFPFEVVSDLANQFSGQLDRFKAPFIQQSVLVCLGWAALLFGASGLIFARRDISGS